MSSQTEVPRSRMALAGASAIYFKKGSVTKKGKSVRVYTRYTMAVSSVSKSPYYIPRVTLPAASIVYINELYQKHVTEEAVDFYLQDLHPNRAKTVRIDDKEVDLKLDEPEDPLGVIYVPEEIEEWEKSFQRIDRNQVTARGALPKEWITMMLDRRHGTLRQTAVVEIANAAFILQEECVYSEGRPVRYKVDLTDGADPTAKIYTEEEVTALRDAYYFERTHAVKGVTEVNPILMDLVSRIPTLCQSAVKDLANQVQKIVDARNAFNQYYAKLADEEQNKRVENI